MLARFAIIATVLAAAPAVARGPDMRFAVPEPFQVGAHQNGAGTIALRQVGVTTSPVALIEVWIDGRCVGALRATRNVDGAVSRRDEALFRRDGDRRLVMVGFRVAGDRAGSFHFLPEGGLIAGSSTLAGAHTPTLHR